MSHKALLDFKSHYLAVDRLKLKEGGLASKLCFHTLLPYFASIQETVT